MGGAPATYSGLATSTRAWSSRLSATYGPEPMKPSTVCQLAAGVGVGRNHEGGRRGRDLREVARRVTQRDHQRRVVRRLDGDVVLRSAGQSLLGAGNDAQHVGCRAAGRRVQDAQPRPADVLGPERRAVRELEAVSQPEGVGPAVVAHRPRLGQGWIRLAVLVQPRQARIQLEQELHVGRVADEGRIQGLWLAAQVAEHVVGRLGGARGQRRIEGDDQGESEHRDPDRQAGPQARRGQAGHAAASIRARAAAP